jgi:hypothetical protein
MATKTEIKTAQIPNDIKKYVDIVIEELKRKIETGDFRVEINYDSIAIKISDIKAYLSKNRLYIIYKDIDIIYSDYFENKYVVIKVFKDMYNESEIYRAYKYWTELENLHKLALEKVKEKLEKLLIEL